MAFVNNPEKKKILDEDIWGNGAFPNKLSKDEDIIIVVRRDISLIILKSLALFSVFVILFIFGSILNSTVADPLFLSGYNTLLYTVNLFLILMFTIFFHNYYLSMQIVTTERIIDVDQTGLFVREIDELHLGNIQNISYKQTSVLAFIFGFGDIIVETASGGDAIARTDNMNGFVFDKVPHPKEIVAVINDLYVKYREEEQEDIAKINAKYIHEGYKDKRYGGKTPSYNQHQNRPPN
jgi:hypothetical protein